MTSENNTRQKLTAAPPQFDFRSREASRDILYAQTHLLHSAAFTARAFPVMASTRVLEVEREPPVVVTNTARPGSRLPRSLRFPIFVALTFFLRGLLNEFASEYIGEELSLISKTENEEWQPFALLGYKVLLLWFTWKANYDCKCIC
jgi:hypothetical protein